MYATVRSRDDITTDLCYLGTNKPCGKAAGSKLAIGDIAPFILPLIINSNKF